MRDALKVDLDSQAAETIKEIAEELGIKQIEVIRYGLTFMSLYATLKKEKKGRVLIEQDNSIRELNIP